MSSDKRKAQGELASLQLKLGVDYKKKKIDDMLKEIGLFDWEKLVYESNMGSQLKAAKQKTEKYKRSNRRLQRRYDDVKRRLELQETNTAEQPKTAMAGCASGDNYEADLIDDDSSNEAGGFQFYEDETTGPDAHAQQGTCTHSRQDRLTSTTHSALDMGTQHTASTSHDTHAPTTQSMPEVEAQQSTPPSPAHDDAPATQSMPENETQEFNSTPPEHVDAELVHEVMVDEVDTRQGEHTSTQQQEKRKRKRKPKPVIEETNPSKRLQEQ